MEMAVLSHAGMLLHYGITVYVSTGADTRIGAHVSASEKLAMISHDCIVRDVGISVKLGKAADVGAGTYLAASMERAALSHHRVWTHVGVAVHVRAAADACTSSHAAVSMQLDTALDHRTAHHPRPAVYASPRSDVRTCIKPSPLINTRGWADATLGSCMGVFPDHLIVQGLSSHGLNHVGCLWLRRGRGRPLLRAPARPGRCALGRLRQAHGELEAGAAGQKCGHAPSVSVQGASSSPL